MAIILATLGLAGVLLAPGPAAAQTPPGPATNATEAWVLAHLAAGSIADLAHVDNSADRVLTAAFLEGLLTGNDSGMIVHRVSAQENVVE